MICVYTFNQPWSFPMSLVALLVSGCYYISDEELADRLAVKDFEDTTTDTAEPGTPGDTGEEPADLDGDGVAALDDCDDADGRVGAASTWYADLDGDLYGDVVAYKVACEAPNGYVLDATDCNDADASSHPGVVWFADGDLDGYGDAGVPIESCTQPVGYVLDATDCDDQDETTNPDGVEVCDETDNDCDGVVDPAWALDALTWFADTDSDGYGTASDYLLSCAAPPAYVLDATDCDDGMSTTHPGASETCNLTDDDCDGLVDPVGTPGSSTWYMDADLDGYGDATVSATTCTQPTGYLADDTDCDDTDTDIHPDAVENCDTTEDDDCDGALDAVDALDCIIFYEDVDGDGYGSGTGACTCEMGTTYTAIEATDCDDTDVTITEGSTLYADADGDGYGDASVAVSSCTALVGYVNDDTDCDDGDGVINPGSTETAADGIDQDCDGVDLCEGVTLSPGAVSVSAYDMSVDTTVTVTSGCASGVYIDSAGSFYAGSGCSSYSWSGASELVTGDTLTLHYAMCSSYSRGAYSSTGWALLSTDQGFVHVVIEVGSL